MQRLLNKKCIFLCVFIISATLLQAQNNNFLLTNNNDKCIILNNQFTDSSFIETPPHFFLLSNKNAIVKFNPVHLVFSALMYSYQNFISKQLSTSCIYERSCSRFSRDLIHDYGLIKGVFLSVDRVMRCNSIAATDAHYSKMNQKTGKIIEKSSEFKLK